MLHSANYSLGIAVFRKMLEQFGSMLKESFDVEVVEKHHNQKADAPSGTAKLLVQALDPQGELRVVTGREGCAANEGKMKSACLPCGRYSGRGTYGVFLRRGRDTFHHALCLQPAHFCCRGPSRC